jgi:hypothetical protein
MATTLHPITHRFHIPVHRREAGAAVPTWWQELAWVAMAAVVTFAVTIVFSGVLEVSRGWFVLIYALATVPILVGYVLWSGVDLRALFMHRWMLGVAGAIVFGAFVVMSVQRQDASARPEGARLVWDLVWLGVIYGLIDALVLSVLPVLATWRAFSVRGWTMTLAGKVGVGALAIAASLLVAAAYHLGFSEYRDGDLRNPLIGNGVMSLGYVLTNNPITAIGSHIAMHVAAVLQGADTTVQLPPHY